MRRGARSVFRVDIAVAIVVACAVRIGAHPGGVSIAVNFGSSEPAGAGSTIEASAGALGTSRWNNLTGSTGTLVPLDADIMGARVSGLVKISWVASNTWASTGLGEENNGAPPGDDRDLMTGYLDTTETSVTRVRVTGLSSVTTEPVEVYVYINGAVQGRGGTYRIDAQSASHMELTAFDGTYREGRDYIVLRSFSEDGFTLSAQATNPDRFRAPINGIEIVAGPAIDPAPPVMRVTGGSARTGETIELGVELDVRTRSDGWVVALCHDPDVLEFEDHRLGDDVPLEPEFLQLDNLATGVTVGVIFDSTPPFQRFLPAGYGLQVHRFFYGVLALGPTTTEVSLCDNRLGAPLKENVVLHDGLTVHPVREDAEVEILPAPPDCPRNLSCRTDLFRGEVVLTWNGPSSPGLSGYRLRRDGIDLGPLDATLESFTDTPPRDFVTREFAVTYQLVPEFAADPTKVCEPLVCTALLIPPPPCFADDFDDYLTDEDLQAGGDGWRVVDENNPVEPAAWTVTNPGRRRNPPSRNGLPTSGRFVISDSRFANCFLDDRPCENIPETGMSYDLWSPTIACPGLDPIWLHFDCNVQFEIGGDAVFDVDVSIDDGASWTNAFRRVSSGRGPATPPQVTLENSNGFYGRLDVELTPFVAGADSFRIRFRHFEPTNDYWIAIDNVVVDGIPPPRILSGSCFANDVELRVASQSCDVFFDREPFLDGLPSGWGITSRLNNTGDFTWNFADSCSRSAEDPLALEPSNGFGLRRVVEDPFPLVDSFCAAMDPVNSGRQYDEILMTPPIDCSGFTEVFVVFDDETLWFEAPQSLLLSTDGGNNFVEEDGGRVFCYTDNALHEPGGDPFFARRGFSVRRAAGESSVVFALIYQQNRRGQEGWWAVDNISVWGHESNIEFLRGDANADGVVDIADASYMLNFLFLGGPEPPCLASMEVNGDFSIDLSDPVATLNFLFLGGLRPPNNYPECGVLHRPDIIIGCLSPAECE